jgi:hypothetical protein
LYGSYQNIADESEDVDLEGELDDIILNDFNYDSCDEDYDDDDGDDDNISDYCELNLESDIESDID